MEPLLKSTQPFVADYAATALATIAHHVAARPTIDAATLDADLQRLPAAAELVGQERLTGGGVLGLDNFGALSPRGNLIEMYQRSDRIRTATVRELTLVAELVGNVRIDGITFGCTAAEDNPQGWLVLRGQFDQAAVFAAFDSILPAIPNAGCKAYSLEDQAICFPAPGVIWINADGSTIARPEIQAALQNRVQLPQRAGAVRNAISAELNDPHRPLIWAVSSKLQSALSLGGSFENLIVRGTVTPDAALIVDATTTAQSADALADTVHELQIELRHVREWQRWTRQLDDETSGTPATPFPDLLAGLDLSVNQHLATLHCQFPPESRTVCAYPLLWSLPNRWAPADRGNDIPAFWPGDNLPPIP
jgi:hypothetical protein